MVSIKIKGGNKIEGEVLISGSKNASLPILISSILTKETVILHNIPFVTDVTTALSLLMNYGTTVKMVGESPVRRTVKIKTLEVNLNCEVSAEASKIRASILLIGPLLSRNSYVKILKPGGCNIGERKINFHIAGMKALGAEILETKDFIELTTNGKRLQGADIFFPSISVGATQNVIMAAVLAEGITKIHNAAVEPEVIDLINFLNTIGAKIKIAGERIIEIEGVDTLFGGEYTIMPDRIEALTYAMLSCATGGQMLLKNVSKQHLIGGVEVLERIGFEFLEQETNYPFGGVCVKLKNGHIKNADVETEAFPGFATDLQPQLGVLLLLAKGKSSIAENIFENRFQHVAHLMRMGADISFENPQKINISYSPVLKGAVVQGTDLRACASLIMAGLLAEGETTLLNAESLDRGYSNFIKNIINCGGNLYRVN